jgi:hypothetical protein
MDNGRGKLHIDIRFPNSIMVQRRGLVTEDVIEIPMAILKATMATVLAAEAEIATRSPVVGPRGQTLRKVT